MGKGGTNHLHRAEVIEALRRRGVEITFVVREDYLDVLPRFEGCAYVTCAFAEPGPYVRYWRDLLRGVRRMYPSRDPGVRVRLLVERRDIATWGGRLLHVLFCAVARYRAVMCLLVAFEGWFYRNDTVAGLDPATFDQLLLLGVGTFGTEADGRLTWWARRNGVPVVHMVGNYDGLSSKGFRGAPVERLLVWGESMREDAVCLQAIPAENIRLIGAVRYDSIGRDIRIDRETFLREHGLDPQRKTVLFAGSRVEYHYFEMLEAYKELLMQDDRYQLIVRIYPTKRLMASPYIEALLTYAASLSHVYVSIGDPHYRAGDRERETLRIEEEELWHSLKYADVVVNLYSTLALEACIFDRPVINMWYFGTTGQMYLRRPVYIPYPKYFHIRKLVAYGGAESAHSRAELLQKIRAAVVAPTRLAEGRRRTVAAECGTLDGRASERLAETCMDALREWRTLNARGARHARAQTAAGRAA